MDFQALIRIAQENSQAQAASGRSNNNRSEIKSGYYSTKYEPPKKQNKEKKISANVQKFLQSQESKPKSAQSTASSRQNTDPDGFESREASQIYEKLLNRFETASPSNSAIVPKSSSSTRDSSKAKSSNKSKSSKSSEHGSSSDSSKKYEHSKSTSDKSKPAPKDGKQVALKSKPPPPKPVLDFNSILKLAEQNKAGVASAGNSVSKSGPTRLLTEKEKQKLASEKERRNPQLPNHSKTTLSTAKDHKSASSSKTTSDTKSKCKSKPNASEEKPRAVPPADVRTRTFPPADTNKSRPFPPSHPFHSRRPDPPKPNRKRHIIDDDESDYDSDMDDFIDDDEGGDDYSQHIKDIFGYDKSRYRHLDDNEDDNMESTFAQQMREEQISKKIGLMEDLEDMRAEAAAEAEKRRRRKARK